MLFARALSNGARWYTSDAFCGYSVEEMEAPLPNSDAKPTTVTLDAETGEVTNDEKA
jgi:hypothetical protein